MALRIIVAGSTALACRNLAKAYPNWLPDSIPKPTGAPAGQGVWLAVKESR
jgi:hypothetical protein